MTDRLKGFIVALEHDMREDDAELVKNAILAIRHVLSVVPVITDFNDHINRSMVRRELEAKLYEALREEK